jgi:ADP-heptose:LPS heptosyltransferase
MEKLILSAMSKSFTRPQTILVHMNREPVDAFGEVFMRLPFLRVLREWAPQAHISIIPGFGGAPLWEVLIYPLVKDLVNEIIRSEIPDPAQRKFDWVFDMEGDARTSFQLRRLARKNFHTAALRGFLNLPHLPINHGKHVAKRYLGLLQQATGVPTPPLWPYPIPEAYRQAAKQILPLGSEYIGIAPGAGVQVTGKCWPIERFVSVAKHQSEQGRIPVIFLSGSESGWESHFQSIPHVRFPLSENSTEATGVPSDPVLTASLAERLHAAVANCSGTGHMLALGGAPLVSLFGPSKAEKFHPIARKAVHLKPADGGKNISGIALDSVIAAIESIISPPLAS